jgi:hypothetical protein
LFTGFQRFPDRVGCGTVERDHDRHRQRDDRAVGRDQLDPTSPLELDLAVTPTTATTNTTVTASATLANHTTASQTVTGTATLAFTATSGRSPRIPVPFRLTLAPCQTLSKSVSFTIQSWFPRGTYTVTVTAMDTAGDTATGSASLSVN